VRSKSGKSWSLVPWMMGMIDSKGINKTKTVRRRVMKGMKNMELIAEQADSNSYLATTEIVDVQDPARFVR